MRLVIANQSADRCGNPFFRDFRYGFPGGELAAGQEKPPWGAPTYAPALADAAADALHEMMPESLKHYWWPTERLDAPQYADRQSANFCAQLDYNIFTP